MEPQIDLGDNKLTAKNTSITEDEKDDFPCFFLALALMIKKDCGPWNIWVRRMFI